MAGVIAHMGDGPHADLATAGHLLIAALTGINLHCWVSPCSCAQFTQLHIMVAVLLFCNHLLVCYLLVVMAIGISNQSYNCQVLTVKYGGDSSKIQTHLNRGKEKN